MGSIQIGGRNGDRTYLVVKNVSGAVITTGEGVSFFGAAGSIDGIGVSKLVAAGVHAFAGIADQDMASNAFGRIVSGGVADSVQISNVGTSITITKGEILKPGAVAGTFFSSVVAQAASTLMFKYVVAMTTPVTISALGESYCKGLVKA